MPRPIALGWDEYSPHLEIFCQKWVHSHIKPFGFRWCLSVTAISQRFYLIFWKFLRFFDFSLTWTLQICLSPFVVAKQLQLGLYHFLLSPPSLSMTLPCPPIILKCKWVFLLFLCLLSFCLSGGYWWCSACCAPLMIMLTSVSVLCTFCHLLLTCSPFYDPPPMLYIPLNIFDPPAPSKIFSFLFG